MTREGYNARLKVTYKLNVTCNIYYPLSAKANFSSMPMRDNKRQAQFRLLTIN